MDIVILAVAAVTLLCSIVILIKTKKDSSDTVRTEIDRAMQSFGDIITKNQREIGNMQTERFAQIEKATAELKNTLDRRLDVLRQENTQAIDKLRQENSEQLISIRKTVDEKLQETLESRISKSFKLVSERLEEVYKGLGEMQTLSRGVGDLKKVLSNVKTRGILGEMQLGAILEEILSTTQYETNFATVPGSRNVVEFAIKLPDNNGNITYMPIDSKFPADTYEVLLNAYESGDKAEVEAAAKMLRTRLLGEAKEIHEKYVSPPYTTDFGIMFLPVEGLYAEAVNRGLIEELQNTHKVMVAGPSTMAAMLSAIRMGFKTLAIQKQTSQVWEVLGAVKTEFEKFESILVATQKHLTQANDDLDKLVGVRTRAIVRKLGSVESIEKPLLIEEAEENADVG
ncbi:MAG: DNA recombination protein RmuC [Clostridia bacterium]|nr:DNA recombination protein RmuC [Clostridia bacterium]